MNCWFGWSDSHFCRLETDIQNLEQHLEAMRATYQLNTEKLEYNYRVLVRDSSEGVSSLCVAQLGITPHCWSSASRLSATKLMIDVIWNSHVKSELNTESA